MTEKKLIKSVLLLQDLYRQNREFIKKTNVELRSTYLCLRNIMLALQTNYDNKVVRKDRYDELMGDIDGLLKDYKKIPHPITLRTFLDHKKMDIKLGLEMLKEKIKRACKDCGSSTCSEMLKIFVGSHMFKNISQTYECLLQFFDNFFVPISCNHINLKKTSSAKKYNIDEECLPFAKITNNNPHSSLLEKIEGADVFFSYKKDLVVITGYFKKDPLNIAKTGGTLQTKYDKVINKANALLIPEGFKTGYLNQISLRDFLVYDEDQLVDMISKSYKELSKYKRMSLSMLVKDFIQGNNEKQRKILTLFLLSDSEDQFVAHIIYDMICNPSELLKAQPMADEIYKSLHWSVQKLFRIAFKNVENKIAELAHLTEDDIPYEKRISLIKAPDNVKQKAMEKLKEIKGTKESSVKAQQYLDGLLKIPFGNYRKEPILQFLEIFSTSLTHRIKGLKGKLSECKCANEYEEYAKEQLIGVIDLYDSRNHNTCESIDAFLREVENTIRTIKTHSDYISPMTPDVEDLMDSNDKCLKTMSVINNINQGLDEGENDDDAMDRIEQEINKLQQILKSKYSANADDNAEDVEDQTELEIDTHTDTNYNTNSVIIETETAFLELMREWIGYKRNKKAYLKQVKSSLDDSVYGHQETKQQLVRLVAQWMNGKMKGNVFGFHGPPGVGKTSLAKKGLSKCLVDDDNNPRPFAFLAVAGTTNGSILEGHSYTYMGSTWGRIVDILMETKCMNPIIYIDELDKVSETEHGQEIIGILTHLTDPSQNNEFSDRYFAGIKFDLSQALIVFSYNDPYKIDRVLKDRITEIKVKPLGFEEKVHIVKDYSLPEILDTVGYKKGDIFIEDETIKHLIGTYTNEAGVRKLNEKLFEIVREINHQKITEDIKMPFEITAEYIDELFLNKPKVHIKKIAKEPHVGIVNGLYATSTGVGGITIIEVVKTPSERKLSLELTGQQGDVMKESMLCAKTLAWNLLPKNVKKELNDEIESFGNFGLHIHCPEASTPKDGPSAGCAITTAILSRLCNVKIRNNVAMTGEIDLHGNVHAIGGLDAKLMGAKKAGVDTVIVPKDNEDDYRKILADTKEQGGELDEDHLTVHIVSNIFEVIQIAFVENELEFVNFCN